MEEELSGHAGISPSLPCPQLGVLHAKLVSVSCLPTPRARSHQHRNPTKHLRLLNQVVCQVLHHHIAVSCTGSKRAECRGLQPASEYPCMGTWHGTAS